MEVKVYCQYTGKKKPKLCKNRSQQMRAGFRGSGERKAAWLQIRMQLHQSDMQIFAVYSGGGGNKEEWGLKVLVIFLDAIKAFYLEGAIREGSKNDTAIQTSTLVGQMLGTPAVLQELGGIKQLLQSQPGMEQRA